MVMVITGIYTIEALIMQGWLGPASSREKGTLAEFPNVSRYVAGSCLPKFHHKHLNKTKKNFCPEKVAWQ